MPESLSDVVAYVDIVAPLATVAIAVIALAMAWAQLNASRAQQREATAYAIYSDQLKLDLQFPEFAAPDLTSIKRSGRVSQYDDYVSHLLFACENILSVSRDPAWRWAVKNYLREHTTYLDAYYVSSDAPYRKEFRTGYSSEMIKLVQEVMAGTDARSPVTSKPAEG